MPADGIVVVGGEDGAQTVPQVDRLDLRIDRWTPLAALPVARHGLGVVLTTTAPQKLGAANFAAISNPTPALSAALKTLAAVGPGVQKAAADSPRQWRTFFFVGVAGQVVFIPLIMLMAGYWDPRRAKRAEQEHDAWLTAEMNKLGH
jgi:hypothetical protein